MNELRDAVKTINIAIRTVRIMDLVKKVTVSAAAIICCLLFYRRYRR